MACVVYQCLFSYYPSAKIIRCGVFRWLMLGFIHFLVTHLSAEFKVGHGVVVPENFAQSQLYFFKIGPPLRIFIPAVTYQHAQLSRKTQEGKREKERGFN